MVLIFRRCRIFIVLLSLMMVCAVRLVAQHPERVGYNFNKADSVAKVYAGHSLRDLQGLAYKLTSSLPTDHEKFRAIYYWVCNNVENDYEYFLLNEHKRAKCRGDRIALAEWNKKFTMLVFQRLVKDQKTVCSGYAYLVKELCAFIGLRCEIIEGYGKASASRRFPSEPNHSWNAVQLNGSWYLCDATWSSGAMDVQHNIFVKRFNERYFLADPKIFFTNHHPVDARWDLLGVPASNF